MLQDHRLCRQALALALAVLLLTAAVPGALAADAKTGTVSAPTGIQLLLAAPGGEAAGEVPDGSVVSILSEETDGNGTIWYYIQKPGGETGYVPAANVTISVPQETPAPTETSAPQETPSAPEGSPAPTSAEESGDYTAQLRALGFPESYLDGLRRLHEQYPSWEFRPFFTNLDWNTAVDAENVLGRSLVWGSAPSSWKSMQDGAFNWTDNTWVELDSGGWVAASREIIAHYMDPRNFLDESAVFQFLYQGFDGDTQKPESLALLIAGTFLADTSVDTDLDASNGVNTYAETLYTAGADHGVSPYILAAMMLQEMGTNGASDSVSGTNRRFPGYYNAFNIGAYKTAEFSAVERGLWYASGGANGRGTSWGRPWNSLYKAIHGGAAFYAANYVGAGQNTLYLKRFNVQGDNMYRNQYMTNVAGASSEGRLLSYAYSAEMRSSPLVFCIPVYRNMPAAAVPAPSGDGSPNTKLASLSLGAGTITPDFSRDVREYTVIVPNDTERITVTAAPLSAAAKVSGAGEYMLAVGVNTITLTVTAESGSSEMYTISVHRRSPEAPVTITGPYAFSADSRVSGIAPGTTFAAFSSALGLTGGTLTVTDASGAAKRADAPMCTGDLVVILYDHNGTAAEFASGRVVVAGDINGDGAVTISDLIKLRNHLLGAGELTGLSLAAADVDRSGSAAINDLIRIRNHLLGTAAIAP